MALKTTDRSVAERIVLRLNTMLAELDDLTLTPEQLQKIARDEAARTLAMVERNLLSAKLIGAAHDPSQVINDLQAGWASRLIAVFGNMDGVSFDMSCPARAYLERHGVDHRHFAGIREHFNTFRFAWIDNGPNSETGRLLSRAGIPNNPMTRQRATEARLDARADILVDVTDRYPAVNPEDVKSHLNRVGGCRRQDARRSGAQARHGQVSPNHSVPSDTVSSSEHDLADLPQTVSSGTEQEPYSPRSIIAATGATTAPPIDTENGVTNAAELAQVSTAGAESVNAQPSASEISQRDNGLEALTKLLETLIGPQNQPKPNVGAEPGIDPRLRKNLLFDDFEVEFAKLERRKTQKVAANRTLTSDTTDQFKSDWTAKTAKQARQINEIMISVARQAGLSSFGELQQRHIAALRDLMDELPSNWGQRLRRDAPTPSAETLSEWGRIAQNGGKPIGLKTTTVRRHFTYVGLFVSFLRSQGFYLDPSLDFASLTPRKKPKIAQNKATEKNLPDFYRDFFGLPMFSGCQDAENFHQPGGAFYHCGLTLCPLLYYYLGTRRQEMAGLRPTDVVEEAGTWIIKIPDGKTPNAVRVLPIPYELVRVGFVDYVGQIRALGYHSLFPDLFSPWVQRDPGANLYTRLSQIMAKCVRSDGSRIAKWPRFFHSFRHTFSTTLYNAGVQDSIVDDLLGHARTGTNGIVYRGGLLLEKKIEARSHMPVITSEIESRRVRLLPHVANKDLRGWGEPRSDWDGRQRQLWL